MKAFLFWLLAGLAAAGPGWSQPRPLDARLSQYTYPYPVDTFQFSSQQQALAMAYMRVKPAHPTGKNVLLLHGKNFNGAYWKTTIAALVAEGYQVIVPDQIGFGKSTKPRHFQYSFQELARQTKALLDSLGIEQTAVLGHSMGGMLATRFALMYPQATTKLILENPIGLEDWRRYVPYQPVMAWYRAELKQTAAGIRHYQLVNYYGGQWQPAYDEWADLLAGWTLHPDHPLVAWNAALTYDMIFTQPVVYEWGQLTCPTLLIIGTRDRTALGKDRASPEQAARLGRYDLLGRRTQRAIAGSELVEIPGVGHLPHIERFEAFIIPLKRFLKK